MQPLISGFTFIRNGLSLGYPIKESIESLEPLCDQIVITVGFDDPELESDDGTYQYLRDHFQHKKFLFQRSYWDPAMKKDGLVLSQQSNYSLRECRGKYCHYLQADEVLHEKDLPLIHNLILEMEKNKNIEGIVYDFHHFYSNSNLIRHTYPLPRREIRVIRNKIGIKSWKNGFGFRNKDDKKLKCLKIPAHIFHYGHALKEEHYIKKENTLNEIFFPNQTLISEGYRHLWGIKKFEGEHPKVIKNWIEKNNNQLEVLKQKPKHEMKNILYAVADQVEHLTGFRLKEYKNYKLI